MNTHKVTYKGKKYKIIPGDIVVRVVEVGPLFSLVPVTDQQERKEVLDYYRQTKEIK